MKIAHVTATYPPHNTGTGNVAHNNAVEMVRRGYEVHTFTVASPGLPSEEQVDGVTVHRLQPLLRYGNASLLPALYWRLRHFDLVHLHMPFYGGSEAIYLLKQIVGTPLVITHHQDVHLDGPAGLISRLHDHLLGRRLMQVADRTCFTSLDYARASKYAPLLQQGRVRVGELPNGVDTATYKPGPRPPHLVQQYDVAQAQVLLFVGVLDRAHYFKGVDVLLRALARMQHPDITLIIVGKGDMRAEYERQAASLGLSRQVHFPGFIPDADLPGYYQLADVTVLPSTTAGEAFGLVLLESLASATPVIASSLPGVRTVVMPHKDGFLVPPGDSDALAQALKQMLDLSYAERQAMGMSGRRKVEQQYAWKRIGAHLEELYQNIIGPHRERTHSLPATRAIS